MLLITLSDYNPKFLIKLQKAIFKKSSINLFYLIILLFSN